MKHLLDKAKHGLNQTKDILDLEPDCGRAAFKQGLDDGQLKRPSAPHRGHEYPNAVQRVIPANVRLYEGNYLVGYVDGRTLDETLHIELGLRIRDDDDGYER